MAWRSPTAFAMSAPMASPGRYRPNVGVVLFRRDGRVWLGRRAKQAGPRNWQFPQGGIDPGEELEAAARRELHEETGVSSARVLGRAPGWIAYDFPPDYGGSKRARGFRGQKQCWFAMLFEGKDAEIDLNLHAEIEFDAWRWAELDEAMEAVVDFKRDAYRQVLDHFRLYAETLRASHEVERR
jgi:putative (di)nucleoside polyphosphate hydrolase